MAVIRHGWIGQGRLGNKMQVIAGKDIFENKDHQKRLLEYKAFRWFLAKDLALAQKLLDGLKSDEIREVLAADKFEALYRAAREGNIEACEWFLNQETSNKGGDLTQKKAKLLLCFEQFYVRDRLYYANASPKEKIHFEKIFNKFVKLAQDIEAKPESKWSLSPDIYQFPQVKSPIALQSDYELRLKESQSKMGIMQWLNQTIRSIKPASALVLTFGAGAAFTYAYPKPVAYISSLAFDYLEMVPGLDIILPYLTCSNLLLLGTIAAVCKISYDYMQSEGLKDLLNKYKNSVAERIDLVAAVQP